MRKKSVNLPYNEYSETADHIHHMLEPATMFESLKTVSGMLSHPCPISIILWDEESQHYTSSYSTLPGQPPDLMTRKVRATGATHHILTTRQELCVPDALESSFEPNPILQKHQIHSYLGTPLLWKRRSLGVLYALNTSKGAFHEQDATVLRCASQLVSQVIDTTQQIALIQQEANFDELTQIWRRRPFLSFVAERLSLRAGGSLLIIDIDHFKKVNDTYGHLVGDSVLQQVASLLRQNLRTIDCVCRFGGEEFAVFLDGVSAPFAWEIAERIRILVALHRFETPMGSFSVTLSIGITTLSDGDETMDSAISRADCVLYQAKRNGRNQVAFLAP